MKYCNKKMGEESKEGQAEVGKANETEKGGTFKASNVQLAPSKQQREQDNFFSLAKDQAKKGKDKGKKQV